MGSLFICGSISEIGLSSCTSSVLLLVISLIFPSLSLTAAQTSICRTSCGNIPINYPFGIDDGCGSPYYRHILVCSESSKLELRTPSGRYAIRNISYSDPHVLVTDPFMWNCQDGNNFRPTRPFSLDTSTHFSLSTQNDYLFFNCSEGDVIIEPKPIFCERYPDRCDSSCDSASYLCRHLPECASALGSTSSCCSYYPKATESLRLMLKYCATYTSVYWRNSGETPPTDQVPEYGIRIDFDIPVTTRCLQCQEAARGGGTCGFDTQTQSFLCLCQEGNATITCKDQRNYRHHRRARVIAGVGA
ncbi:LEAF RUST 10 DISEASE-RESISTANCE LOCUS RECEPTOR-LIKE PROTEIN KINASE-like 2.7 isoform X2 [Malania oleifera]|uniref:LEAF RUST 10 DISEASE-RESISTANCE LOCUS RECEPTOR-LIKE PROTEIN KINASE-like 2.7 isoform X2 n=1 Tax=Malania oleifera TaxID=397392 RepID=UPI0025ADD690|nr:LEAF RUST 10 DISEASE-RESISTANCE LOCUS RECEPTOR-LIKE PROTEIN KINASE-like 2.7 isoform X2 [Malania oleifera]